jgi:peptidyl-tRNA hydrolase, PTH1 family
MPAPAIKLIVGLGNPGREYEDTRHNAGFWLVDELARRQGGRFRLERSFPAELVRVRIGPADVWLAKPQDYMNNSGRVTAQVAGFYKFEASQVLVAHDDLDLPTGELRLKEGGGAGGHNGLKDLIAHLGDGFWRLRIGVGHPGSRDRVTPWVLSPAQGAERDILAVAVQQAADIVPVLMEQGGGPAMQRLHSKPVE